MIAFPHIDPVALSLGPLQIRWYALAYLAGFLLGWAYALYLIKLNKSERPDKTDIGDFLPWAVIGVILGGRIGYVLFYQSALYMSEPLEIFKVWHGGMSFHGGVLGIIASLFLFSWKRKINVGRLADIVCTVAPIGLFFGRLANFINGELFGRATDAPWGIVFPRGGDIPRHPSQLYEAALEGILMFIILAILVHIKRVREHPGVTTGVFLALYGLMRIIVEFFREPDRQIGYILDYFTLGQVLSVPLMLFGIGLAVFVTRPKPEKSHAKS